MRIVSCLLTLCLACGPATAAPPQEPRAATAQSAPQAPSQAAAPANAASLPALLPAPPVPLLWKVSDGDNALYLLGSFHLLQPDDYPLSPDVDAAFADAHRVLFEMPPGEMQSPTLALRMGQAALRTDGTVLDSELSPQTIARLDAWLAANRDGLQAMALTPESLQRFEPWFVGLLVSLADMTRRGLDPRLGLDEHFAEAAQQAGKQTAGFETGAQQIAYLDGMDKAEQQQFLAEALDESGQDDAELDALHDAWRRGDADMLWNDMARDMQAHYPRLYQRINVERNDAWLPRLDALLRDGHAGDNTLVVVGSLHLLGSDGIVEKLRARGYTVERICSACRSNGG